jgi:molybdenum cofactor cytidylyltransferase
MKAFFKGVFMFDGIVLAGGYSSRFKQNKMCVKYHGKALILYAIEGMHKFCKNVIVVTGYYHQEICECLKGIDYVKIILNKDFSEGMFSSVKAGVNHVEHDFFIIPGDYPFISDDVYKKLIDSDGLIRVPSYNKRLGHPIFMSKQLKDDLIMTEVDNLKDFRNLNEYKIVEVDSDSILKDIDTVEDLFNNNDSGKE